MATLGTIRDDKQQDLLLTVNGRAIVDSSVHNAGTKHPHVRIWPAAQEEIGSLAIQELLANFRDVYFELDRTEEKSARWTFEDATTLFNRPDTASLLLVMRIELDYLNWDKPYSVNDLKAALKNVLSQSEENNFKFWPTDESDDDEFGVSIELPVNAVIADVFRLSERAAELAEKVEEYLLGHNPKNSILLRFEFPPEIRTACGQYLLYFAQFLRDLGIAADTQVKEEANAILFGVTPCNERQALAAIREALALYLRLPDSPIGVVWEPKLDVAAAQLLANVHHLKAQLMLAQAVLQAKDASIAALQAETDFLKTKLNLLQYVPEKNTSTNSASESESVIEGVLAVKKFDWKFLQIDVPELLRRLKRRL